MSAGSSLVHHTRHNVTMQYHKSTHLHVSRQYHTPPCQQAAHTRHNVTMQHHNFTHLHVSRQLACTPHTSHCHNAVSQIHAPPCEQAIISHTSMSAGSPHTSQCHNAASQFHAPLCEQACLRVSRVAGRFLLVHHICPNAISHTSCTRAQTHHTHAHTHVLTQAHTHTHAHTDRHGHVPRVQGHWASSGAVHSLRRQTAAGAVAQAQKQRIVSIKHKNNVL